jgi:hypothetical protein
VTTAMAEVMPKSRSRNTGGRPKKPEPMVPIASLRGKKAFADWFERLIMHCRLNGSTAIEHGLIALAKERGFKEAPPER